MFSTLRNRFGIPGVISVIALVFAMFGGAYAASNSSGGGKATASAKAKKGPRGPKGATGPAGPAGSAGPAGPKGDAGADGSNGAAGSAGAAGKNVTLAEELPGANCAEGGTKVEVEGAPASKRYVCNGEAGPQGNSGSPWTAGGTLPNGSTETGSWSSTAAFDYVSISFPIPLANALEAGKVHYQGEANFASTCTGSAAAPTAPSGQLCVYVALAINQKINEILNVGTGEAGAGKAGAVVSTEATSAQGPTILGTWAVTG